jgi:hypothetical protein
VRLRIDDPNQRRLSMEKHANPEVSASLVIDERSQEVLLAVTFNKNLGDRSTECFDRDLCEDIKALRKQLLKKGAALPGSENKQLNFLNKLIQSMDDQPKIRAMKPGFREGVFILGREVFGPNRGRYIADLRPDTRLGAKCGTLEDWQRDVAVPLRYSTTGAFGLMAALSASLYGYLAEVAPDITNIFVSESATFSFWGESATGRTTIMRTAAATYGCPNDISDWNFTARGLEEDCEQHNHLPLVLDDVEKFRPRGGLSLLGAMRAVNQTIPAGKSQAISIVARKNDLPALEWLTVGLSTSPRPSDDLIPTNLWSRSKGEKVRLIDIAVPPAKEGGIFDRTEGADEEKVEAGKKLIRKLEDGVARNFGLAMPAFVEYLLKRDRTQLIKMYVDRFISIAAKNGNGYDVRFARKFALAYAAGRLGIKSGLLPWRKSLPMAVVQAIYRQVVEKSQTNSDRATQKVVHLAETARTGAFQWIKLNKKASYQLKSSEVGFRTSYKDNLVCAIRDSVLEKLCGSRVVRLNVLARLREMNALVTGQGHAGTIQLPLKLLVVDRKGRKQSVKKPRFWLIRISALKPLLTN